MNITGRTVLALFAHLLVSIVHIPTVNVMFAVRLVNIPYGLKVFAQLVCMLVSILNTLRASVMYAVKLVFTAGKTVCVKTVN